MANITQILGTDSLSSSRIILNDNFSELNTGLSAIEALLDTSNQNLTLTGKVISGELEVFNGSIKFAVTPTQIVSNVESKHTADVVLQKGISYETSSSAGSGITILPTVNQYDESTIFIDASSFLTPISLFAAQEGREVTFIADGGPVTFAVNGLNQPIVGYGTTDITVLQDRTITLRYYGSSWYVISNC
jgi:hypothetical protein